MAKASLKKVFIKNFKSLHDCEIDIEKMNVVVGANASGKSNLIEAFRLLKKIYVDKDSFPFLEWWGYDNVVWQRKEELPIIIGLLFDIEGYDVYFETNFTGMGGKFQILREVLDFKGYLKFEKKGEWMTVIHDVKFIDAVIKKPQEYDVSSEEKTVINKQKENLIKEARVRLGSEARLVDIIQEIQEIGYGNELESAKLSYEIWDFEDWKILAPVVHCETNDYSEDVYNVASEIILFTLNKLLILYPLNIRSMKSPQPFRREEILKEDGGNIASVYHTIYLKEGKIPEEIYNPLSMVFPKIDVRPHITDDGRVMIKFFEDGLELLPPNTSDGFYKILTVLTAIYLKPPLLIIDEIENSLHPSTLELILDTIKIGDTQAIITTHSPVVVDMTELSNIILVEKEQGESKFKRIKDPEKIKEFLIEKGITFSEGWIYGDLFKTEKQA
ncbi:MAG: AAA family ATPase [Candidatus Methanoperedens sp.]